MSNSASGGAAWMKQRTVINRDVFNQVIDALLDGDESQRITAAMELSEAAPSWWSGPTRHRVRTRQEGRQ